MKSDDFEMIKAEYTHDEQVLRITLSDPPGNVLFAKMMAEIGTYLEKAKTLFEEIGLQWDLNELENLAFVPEQFYQSADNLDLHADAKSSG